MGLGDRKLWACTNTLTAWIIVSEVWWSLGASWGQNGPKWFLKPGLAQWAAGLVACPDAYAKKATTKRPGDGDGMAWLKLPDILRGLMGCLYSWLSDVTKIYNDIYNMDRISLNYLDKLPGMPKKPSETWICLIGASEKRTKNPGLDSPKDEWSSAKTKNQPQQIQDFSQRISEPMGLAVERNYGNVWDPQNHENIRTYVGILQANGKLLLQAGSFMIRLRETTAPRRLRSSIRLGCHPQLGSCGLCPIQKWFIIFPILQWPCIAGTVSPCLIMFRHTDIKSLVLR